LHNADANIVVQDVDAAEALLRERDHRLERLFLRHVSLQGHAFASVRHRRGFLGGGEIAIDDENIGALLRKAQHGGAAVAEAFARPLPGANDDRDFVLEAHRSFTHAVGWPLPSSASWRGRS
jgi:hypothetical protein